MRAVVVRRVGALVLALGLIGSWGVNSALAAGITVNSLLNTAANDGVCTLREAITAANLDTASGASAGECAAGSGADVITFSVAGTISMPTGAVIAGDVTIAGGGAITVDGANSVQVFAIPGGTVTLSGLTISGGNAFFGAALFNDGATVTLTNSTLTSNTAGGGGGGGIYNDGTLTITDSTISANATSGLGGGIFNNGPLTVTGSTITGNGAIHGGGIFNNLGADLTVTDSTISDNATSQLGGGIFNADTSTLVVSSSTISGNTASGGAGVYSEGEALVVTNSTISGNTAVDDGGGIFTISAGTITNSTISGNSALNSGGGISAAGTESVVNTIIAGNMAPIGPDVDFAAETITTSVIGVPGGKTLADILVPAGLANNGGPTKTIALALVAGNPAIDTGTSATCAAAPVNAVDQRGMPRPAACDIGAYEAQPPTVAAHATVPVAATSASGAVVAYTPPAGTNEQGVAASVACLPASGSAFAVGSTTVTCTATDAVGHTGTGTFQIVVSSFVLPDAALPRPSSGVPGLLALLALIGVLSYLGLWAAVGERKRRR